MASSDNIKINISIENDVASVKIENPVTGTIIKNVSIAALCQLLGNSNVSHRTIVPPGARMIMEKKDSIFVLFIYPQAIRKYYISWNRRARENFELPEALKETDFTDSRHDQIYECDLPYPHMAFLVKVEKDKASTTPGYIFHNMWAFTLKDINRPLDQLDAYQWPLTNVYENYKCCIGDIAPKYPTIESISSIPITFFNGFNNGDLDWNRNFINNPKAGTYGKLNNGYHMVTKIAGRERFPYEYLKPIGNLMVQVNTIIGGN